jgi:hypothetical protein
VEGCARSVDKTDKRHGVDDTQIGVDGIIVDVVPGDDDVDKPAMETAQARQPAASHVGVPV